MKKFIILFILIIFSAKVSASEIDTKQTLETECENISEKILDISNSEEKLEIEVLNLQKSYENAYDDYRQKITNLCSVSSSLGTTVIYDLNTKASVMELITSKDLNNPNYIQSQIDTKNNELKLLYFQKESYQKLKNQIENSIKEYDKKYKEDFNPIWPVPGFDESWVTDVFGGGHYGYDIAAYQGTDIVATQDGTVISADFHWSWGNNVLVFHNEDYTTRYAHMYEMYAKEGDYVKQGDVLGTVGTTGHSTGNHLHFEVYYKGKRVDPYPFF